MEKQGKKHHSLMLGFGIAMAVFTVSTLLITAVITYVNQTNSYRHESVQKIKELGAYMEYLMEARGEEFAAYQEYYMNHFEEMNVPYDFTEADTQYEIFLETFAREYPGKVFGKDVKMEDLEGDSAREYFTYVHESWLLAFEDAREEFALPYTYYITLKEDVHNVVYMIDGERTPRTDSEGNEDGFLYLGDEYNNEPEKYPVEWATWESGVVQDEYQVWDNDWGHTYASYTPLIINGEKKGLIGTEILVASVNRGILNNTLAQTFGIAFFFVVSAIILMWYIDKKFLSKIRRLEAFVTEYSDKKDTHIAEVIEEEVDGTDEIDSLSREMSAMIREIENYVVNLTKARKETDEMNRLAMRDSLTGIRNKMAYDNEVKRIEWELAEDPYKKFGLGMIDLNFLKRLNDTYGHEWGDEAIKKLCHHICVTFNHSPVFRISGDEFVVVLEKGDFDKREELVEEFNSQLEEWSKDTRLEPWERISAAIGIAVYDPVVDKTVSNVFRRADEAMYRRKKEMKAVRT